MVVTVPTAYDTDTLAAFLHQEVGPIGEALGWSVGANSYQQPIIDALLAYGVSTVEDATNVAALRALARRAVWRLALKHLASRYDFSLDQQSMSRSQMQKMAKDALVLVEAEVLDYAAVLPAVSGYTVRFIPIRNVQDPYAAIPASERVLR